MLHYLNENLEHCTCSPERVEGFLRTYFSDMNQSEPSRLKNTLEKSCCNGSGMESCHDSQSGTTYAPLTADHGEEEWTSCAADSLVRTLVSQVLETDSMGPVADYGKKCGESLAKYDLDTHSLRTAQLSLFEEGCELLQTLPKWGMMLDGEIFALSNVARCTYESDYSSLPIPTPNATDFKGGCTKPRNDNGKLRLDQMRHWWKIRTGIHAPDPNFTEGMMQFPIMWTDLKPLEMLKFRQWQRSHGEFFQENELHPCEKTSE